MFRRLTVIAAFAASTAFAASASAAGGPGGGLSKVPAGWDCNPQILIGGFYHCAPPGQPSVADMIAGTESPGIELRVFMPDGSFAGTEHLIRADLYAGQPCPQDNLVTWELNPFGYYACHHFDT